MAVTDTGSLADSKQLIIDSARIVNEYEGVWSRTTDVTRLDANTGLGWEEISLGQLTAQTVTETTVMDNPQSISDTLFQVTPTMTGINVIVTDRVYRRMPKSVIAKMGPLAQNAVDRKMDEDYLATFATATTTLAGTGATLASGVIDSAVTRIKGNPTERAMGTIVAVLHPYQIKDIQDEIKSGVGTYTIPAGLTEEVFRRGFEGSVGGANVYSDGNIAINSIPDARGAVHAREAIVTVKGMDLRSTTRRREEIGGGADEMFIYAEYGHGERSAGNWLYGVLSDATAPLN